MQIHHPLDELYFVIIIYIYFFSSFFSDHLERSVDISSQARYVPNLLY